MKACLLHGAHSFPVVHECLPNQPGAKIFSHQNRYPLVDPNNIGVVPVSGGMECIDKAVSAPYAFSPFRTHSS